MKIKLKEIIFVNNDLITQDILFNEKKRKIFQFIKKKDKKYFRKIRIIKK